MVQEVHTGDVGTKFKLTIYDGSTIVDVSSSTSKYIKFEKPGGTDITKAASFDTDGTDGIIYYTSESGVLDTVGVWKMQAIIGFTANEFRSNVETFRVYPNI